MLVTAIYTNGHTSNHRVRAPLYQRKTTEDKWGVLCGIQRKGFDDMQVAIVDDIIYVDGRKVEARGKRKNYFSGQRFQVLEVEDVESWFKNSLMEEISGIEKSTPPAHKDSFGDSFPASKPKCSLVCAKCGQHFQYGEEMRFCYSRGGKRLVEREAEHVVCPAQAVEVKTAEVAEAVVEAPAMEAIVAPAVKTQVVENNPVFFEQMNNDFMALTYSYFTHRHNIEAATHIELWGENTKVYKHLNDVTIHTCYDMLHRFKGPAVEYASGDKFWYKNDQLHREDGPAIECADGSKLWATDGQYHRLDGPAMIFNDGTKKWFVNGKLHRLNGPAIEWADGNKEYRMNGKKITEEQFLIMKLSGLLDG